MRNEDEPEGVEDVSEKSEGDEPKRGQHRPPPGQCERREMTQQAGLSWISN